MSDRTDPCGVLPVRLTDVASEVDTALNVLEASVSDAVEAAALLFEGSMMIDADWPPSMLLQFIRWQVVARGWKRREVEQALFEETRRRLAMLDGTYARGKACHALAGTAFGALDGEPTPQP